MGEAKRRKKALGDRYGKTPAVLIPGSQQLEDQTDQFTSAYFAQFSTLQSDQTTPEDIQTSDPLTPPDPQQRDADLLEMQHWVATYLEPYRPKDREQLVMGLLEPFYFILFEAPPEFFQKASMNPKTEHMGALLGGLTSLRILHSYLSEDRLADYREPMRDLYEDMLETIEEDAKDTDDRKLQVERLTELFEICLDDNDKPDYLKP